MPDSKQQKPVWAIGHMCNELKYVRQSLERGGNAIECDLEVINPGERQKPYQVLAIHSGYTPAYGGGETPLSAYLRGLASDYMPKLSAVIFDIKDVDGVDYKKYGIELCNAIIDAGIPPERCVLSIPTPKSIALFDGIPDTAAFNRDLSMIDISPAGKPPEQWLEIAEKYGCNWLGMGISAYAPAALSNWLPPLAYAAANKGKKGIVKKVYYWTLDAASSMREVMDQGVDGVICNIDATFYDGLSNMTDIVGDDPKLRMATPSDSLD